MNLVKRKKTEENKIFSGHKGRPLLVSLMQRDVRVEVKHHGWLLFVAAVDYAASLLSSS